ncbi:FG-GAP repeat domain-containing protein, partial [Streptomyces sp. NPDC059605]|uniref:FG-GAP repeat domain-containing protein n=1 Tax=Streptomyces sp. NPDC059605 TaxID=3346882 RepID=UPI00367F736C
MAARALGTTVVLAITVATAVITLPTAGAATPGKAPAAAPASAGTAVPTPAARRDDFNGDGYPDVAFTAPDATVEGSAKAGYVGVVYGSAKGLQTSTKQVFTQDSPGIPGTAAAGVRFGGATAGADLDGDGYGDLVVGAENEKAGTSGSAGSL